MKKLSALLLAFALLFSLAACSGDVPTGSNSTTTAEGSHDTGSSQSESTASDQNDNSEDTAKEEDNSKTEISFAEIVAVDNDECTIKITGIDPDNLWGYTLKTQFENKSADKTYMFSVESASINGVQSDPFFATEVAAGKKSNNEISFSDSELEDNGVGDYTDIELTFHVYDSDDWMADDVARETVHVYPYGEDNAVNFVREPQADDNVILDNDYVTVIVTGYEEDGLWGYTVNLFLLNKTDTNVMFTVDEASVNGYMADPFYATEISAGKCAFGSMSWSDTTLEDNGITAVEEIEFTLRAYDSDDWSADDFANELITLEP